MEIHILGPLLIRAASTVDAPPVALRPGRPRRLVAALALRAGAAVDRDVLIDLLWADRPPQHPVNALQVLVSYLRRSLPGEPDRPAIARCRNGYALQVPPTAVDAHRFDDLLRRRPAGDEPRDLRAALVRLEEALALWRGPAVPELAGSAFAEAEIARLEESRLIAVERRNDLLLGLGAHVTLTGVLSELVTAHPLRERFAEQLMVALYRSGRQGDALATYRRTRARLREELGVEPGRPLQDLQRRVLRHDPHLDPDHAPTVAVSSGTAAAGGRAGPAW